MSLSRLKTSHSSAFFFPLPSYGHEPAIANHATTCLFDSLPRSDNIRFDLLRTGSVEQTTNRILERGYLDAVRTSLLCPLHR